MNVFSYINCTDFKYLIGLTLMLGYANVFSQSKHDANWCFGMGAGINFSNPINPRIFPTKAHNLEVSASISDSKGELLFYLTANGNYNVPSSLLDRDNQLIQNGDSINTDFSCTNCALILPFLENVERYFLFHIGFYQLTGCPHEACYHLYYSIIEKHEDGKFIVTEKNVPILEVPIQEKLSAVKHADGKNWWLLVHELSDCSNKFYEFFINQGSIAGPFIHSVGTPHCGILTYAGEMTFSKSGGKLAMAVKWQGFIEVFNFDRCSGELFNPIQIPVGNAPYGLEFSPSEKLIYFSDGEISNLGLFQCDLNSGNIVTSKKTIWSNSDNTIVYLGQLQLAPIHSDISICA